MWRKAICFYKIYGVSCHGVWHDKRIMFRWFHLAKLTLMNLPLLFKYRNNFCLSVGVLFEPPIFTLANFVKAMGDALTRKTANTSPIVKVNK